MEFVLIIALIPFIAILLAPRKWLKAIAIAAGIPFALGVLWTVSFASSCSSDGCIGIGFLAMGTIIVGLPASLAGIIRWLLIRKEDERSGEQG